MIHYSSCALLLLNSLIIYNAPLEIEYAPLAEEHSAISPMVLDVVLGRWKDQSTEASQSERNHESAGRGLQT